MKKIFLLTGIVVFAASISSGAFAGNTETGNSTNPSTLITATLLTDQAELSVLADYSYPEYGYHSGRGRGTYQDGHGSGHRGGHRNGHMGGRM